MIANPYNFQAIIAKRNPDLGNQYTLNIDGNQVTSEKSVKLLGINIYNNLSFDERLSSLCKKASNQLNAEKRFHRNLVFKEKEVLINCFVLIILPQYGNFAQLSLLGKLKKSKQVQLKLCTMMLIAITKLFLMAKDKDYYEQNLFRGAYGYH